MPSRRGEEERRRGRQPDAPARSRVRGQREQPRRAGCRRLGGDARADRRPQVARQLDAIERERGRLNALQIGDQRAARRAALDVPLERALSRGIERAVDELGDRVAVVVATHTASVSSLTALGCVKYCRIRSRALCTCDFDVPSEIPRIVPTS